MAYKEKKQKIIDLVTSVFDKIDNEENGYNSQKFRALVEPMGEKRFNDFINHMRNGDYKISVEVPNMVARMDMDKLYEAADMIGSKIFQRLRITDPETGRVTLTNSEFPVLNLPIRRTQQTIEKKMNLPEGDTLTDALTGQVTGDDKASRMNNKEIQILYSRGLTQTLSELVQIRGGNPDKYAEFSQEIEETGTANQPVNDEDETRFFTCVECGHKWREDDH